MMPAVAQLLVRNLEETVVKKLRVRAARAGVSVEEEHRRILRAALSPSSKGRKKPSLKEWIVGLSGALDDYDPAARAKDMPREVDL